MLPMWKCCQCPMPMLPIGRWRLVLATLATLAAFLVSLPANAENAYTNHAGNVVSGVVVALDQRTTTISNAVESVALPLSIFPESEQRRIAADYVLRRPEAGTAALRVPRAVQRAIDGADKAMTRSRRRAEKGLCSREESDAFCEKTSASLRSYLKKQVDSGIITPAERKALGR